MATERDDRELHPIAVLAASLLTNEGEAAFAYDGPALERLKEEIAELSGDDALRRAVRDLIRLACYLDTEAGSPRAAAALIEALEVAVEPLRALEARDAGSEEAGDGDAARKEFERFRGVEPASKAPRVGDEAPKGSVKVGTLDYPKRG